MREVSRPVFSFRPTLADPEHKRAWEILQSVPNGQKNAFLVQAILQSADSEKMVGMIRQVIREELQNTHFVSGDPVQAETDEIPAQMLDFLSAMEDGM